jgi:hypothetical protein
MFPFDWLERRRLRKSFSAYVSPGVIELLENNTKKNREKQPPEVKHIQFVIVQLDERDLVNDVAALFQSLSRCNAVLDSNLNVSFFVAVFGSPFIEDDSPQNRTRLVEDLQANLGERVRIAHGECMAMSGLFGGEKRIVWANRIPKFNQIISQLLTTPFGTAIQIPDPGKPGTGNGKP